MAFKLRIPPSGMPVDPLNPGDVPGGVPGGPGGPGSLGLMPTLTKVIASTQDSNYVVTQVALTPVVGPNPGDNAAQLDFGLRWQSMWPDVVAAGGIVMLKFAFNMQAISATGTLPRVQLEANNGIGPSYSAVVGARHSTGVAGTGGTVQFALAGAIALAANAQSGVTDPVSVRASWASGTTNTDLSTLFQNAESGGGGWFLEAALCAVFPLG